MTKLEEMEMRRMLSEFGSEMTKDDTVDYLIKSKSGFSYTKGYYVALARNDGTGLYIPYGIRYGFSFENKLVYTVTMLTNGCIVAFDEDLSEVLNKLVEKHQDIVYSINSYRFYDYYLRLQNELSQFCKENKIDYEFDAMNVLVRGK